jgi:16S rRNA G966 N2-methylase RsmD
METLSALSAPGVLRRAARVVVEQHAKESGPERIGSLELIRTRRYGETSLRVYACDPESLGGQDEAGSDGTVSGDL